MVICDPWSLMLLLQEEYDSRLIWLNFLAMKYFLIKVCMLGFKYNAVTHLIVYNIIKT